MVERSIQRSKKGRLGSDERQIVEWDSTLFLGLASFNADLRFRSGDHALTISGPNPDLKVAQLAQKPFFQGFLASVRCDLPVVSCTTYS